MNKELLPIGTIVKCQNKYLQIIIGYSIPGGNKIDYLFSAYPLSTINIDGHKFSKKYDWFSCTKCFDNNDITQVIFTGYQDEEFLNLKEKLSSKYSIR